jgi:hypothetical protein
MRAKLTPRRLALVGLLFVGLGYATMVQSFSWNQTSHYALIRSLDRDTAIIDPFQSTTGDKALYHGHWYSARAPGLAMFALPWYQVLVATGVPGWTDRHRAPAQRPGDSMIWATGLWGNVLPGLVLLLLIYGLAERFEPGFGGIAALTMGLGTLVLPFSTLLFSHVFTATLGFAAFVLLVRERDGPPRIWPIAAAGVLMGYAISSEYPLFFVALVLGVYIVSRRDTWRLRTLAPRIGAYVAGGLIGVIPLLLYNHLAFGSWTHIAYADIPRQKAGFFGIGTPSIPTALTLMFDSRGMLTLAPVLLAAIAGIVLLHRRGRRAEAFVITAIGLLYLTYNSGYYLPFGGGSPGPRFLISVLPFLSLPLALAFRRWPGPTVSLAGASIAAMLIATTTHPLTGYERETVIWARYFRDGFFQPTIASVFGAGRGWLAISPFFAAVAIGIGLVVAQTARLRLSRRQLGLGVAALGAWAIYAALGPKALGIDAHALATIVHVNPKAGRVHFDTYHPLVGLSLIAVVAGLGSLAAMWLVARERVAAS